MVLIKQGEAFTINASDIQSIDSMMFNPNVNNVLSDPEIINYFEKVAADIKAIAPKAEDFLYFTAVMMHAAEASLLDEKGQIKKDAKGNSVTAYWDKSNGSWKWVCSDPNILPYKNANKDIFPEEELIKAHKDWVKKPLCLDHKSDSVDHIRGLIIDTYYDFPQKRVIALCCLDKKNHPDLARRVQTLTSTAVSMGTAVGQAICFDCQNVARTEKDFCSHMRSKSGYGEINVDLKPIELSLVVNGADPKAHIKHVMAAANSIAEYLELKENHLSKISMNEMIDLDTISEIKHDLEKVREKLEKLEGQAEGVNEEEHSSETTAFEETSYMKVASKLENLHLKVDQLQSTMDKMQKNSEEKNMTDKRAYFQGGGGVNEPTPGRPKYEKEDNESIRNKDDKHMIGQMETGPVTGMHPGYDSFGESEEARKRRLQRLAEQKADDRAMRRQAIVDQVKKTLEKEAYFQGGGDVNEPTPGKPKYEKENYTTVRDKEDKQMVGQAPFPDVGSVDGLHPSPASADEKDELKRKQMLSRAKLRGRFVTAAHPDGSDDKGNSRWNVFADNKLILTATVNEITGGKSDLLYNTVATKDFGSHLLNLVRTNDVTKVASMIKSAQLAPETMPEAPKPQESEMPATDPGMEEGMDLPLEEPVDAGGTGSPEEEAFEVLEVAENAISDLRQLIEALSESPGEELSEFSDLAEEMGRAAKVYNLSKLQVKTGKALKAGTKENLKELESYAEDLSMGIEILRNKSKYAKEHVELTKELIVSAIEDTRNSIANAHKLMKSFIKFAKGSEAVEKQAAALKSDLRKVSQDPNDPLVGLEGETIPMSEEEQLAEERAKARQYQGAPYKAPSKPVAPKTPPAPNFGMPEMSQGPLTDKELDALMRARPGRVDTLERELVSAVPGGEAYKPESKSDMVGGQPSLTKVPGDLSDADMNDLEMTLQDGTKITASDKSTKSGRAALREKLAQKGLQFSDMLGKAHGKGGVTTQLDVKPEGDLAKVETLEEQHAKHMDVALAPPRVRKAAKEIQQLVSEGKIDPEKDFQNLISMGLDKDAVKYWKDFYGDAKDGGSQFAAELVKDYSNKKKAEEIESLRVKIARAYELADEMVRRDMLANDRQAKKAQVDEILKFDEHGFNTFKNFVEKQAVKKESSMPQVGQLISSAEVNFPAPEAKQNDMQAELSQLFASSPLKPRLF